MQSYMINASPGRRERRLGTPSPRWLAEARNSVTSPIGSAFDVLDDPRQHELAERLTLAASNPNRA